jgi:hypothetical protein
MKITHYGNEVRVKFQDKDATNASVSITWPNYRKQYLFIDINGDVTWFSELPEHVTPNGLGTTTSLGNVLADD